MGPYNKITRASFLVRVVRYELTCSPLLPVPPVGHHSHGPGVEASVTTPGTGAGAGAETGRRGHSVTCHVSRHITWIRVFTRCVMLARPGPCQLHLTRRSLRGQFMIWPRARLSPLHPSHQLHSDLNPHFFRQTRSFKDPKQSYSFQIFLSSVINIKQ